VQCIPFFLSFYVLSVFYRALVIVLDYPLLSLDLSCSISQIFDPTEEEPYADPH